MATIYTIEHNGEVFDIEGPDNATESDLMAAIGAGQLETPQPVQTPVESKPVQPSGLKSMASKALDVMGTPGRGVAALAYGAGQLGHAPLQPTLQTMSEMTQPGFKPQNRDQRLADVAGTLTNIAIPTTGVIKAAKTTKLGKILFGASRLKAGKELGRIEEAVGLSQQILEKPTAEGVRIIVHKILPGKDVKKVEAAYLELGKQDPQGLKNLHDVIRGALDASSPKALAQTLQPKILTKAGRARLAINEEAARKALNTIVPGRTSAAEEVSAAITRENLMKPIFKYAKKAAIGAALGAGGTLGYKLTQ